MSLEQALAENTAAVRALTEVLINVGVLFQNAAKSGAGLAPVVASSPAAKQPAPAPGLLVDAAEGRALSDPQKPAPVVTATAPAGSIASPTSAPASAAPASPATPTGASRALDFEADVVGAALKLAGAKGRPAVEKVVAELKVASLTAIPKERWQTAIDKFNAERATP